MNYHIAHSIGEFAETDWDALAGGEIARTHRWQRVMEAGWRGYQPRYALLQDPQGPLAIIIASLSDSFGVETWRQRFQQRLTLTVAPPFSSVNCGVQVRAGAALPALLPHLVQLLHKMARQEKRLLIGISNVPADQLEAWRAQRFGLAAQAPVSVLDLPASYEQYLSGLPKKSRAELRRIRRRAAAPDISFDHAPLAAGEGPQVYALLRQVFARHGAPVEKMPFDAEWFTLVQREMPGEMLLFKGYVDQTLTGVAPCLLSGPTLWWPMVGLHYELARSSYMYFLLMDEMIRWSIEHGIKRIYGGLTSEREKQRHGFKLQARWFCYRAQPAALNKMLNVAVSLARFGKSRLFQPRNVD